MKNYYEVLGVDEKATTEEITKAFKNLAKQHHPDRGGDEAKFKEINEAHDTLKSSQKRHDYDTMRKFGRAGITGGGDHPFFNEDIFYITMLYPNKVLQHSIISIGKRSVVIF